MGKKRLIKRKYQIDKYSISTLISENEEFKTRSAVVLVHGILSGFYMSPVGECLAKYFNVYILDLPGFGDSTKPKKTLKLDEHAEFLARFIEKLNLNKTVLIGNSYGCQIIIRYASHYPGKISHAVLVGPTVDKYARNFYSQTKAFFKDIKNQPAWQGPKAMATEYPKAGIKTLVKTVQDSLQDKPEDILPAIKVPCLVVRGGSDPFVSRKWIEEVASLLPKSTLKEIPGKGHTVNSSAPKELAGLIKNFLDEN